MSAPRFSFLVPTHGRQNFLSEALKSISQQTIEEWECVVVDDASPEPVTLPSDERFRLVRLNRNVGPAAARNSGLEVTRGEAIVFLDDDDLVTPERLEIAEEGLRKASVTLCWGGVVGRPGRIRDQIWMGNVSQTVLCALTPHLGQTAVARDEMPRFDERYLGAQDVEWWLRLAARAVVATVPRVGWLWREHEGTRGLNSVRARIEGRRLLLASYSEYFEENPAAAAFQLKRWGLQMASVGDRQEALRALTRSLRLRPSIETIGNLASVFLKSRDAAWPYRKG